MTMQTDSESIHDYVWCETCGFRICVHCDDGDTFALRNGLSHCESYRKPLDAVVEDLSLEDWPLHPQAQADGAARELEYWIGLLESSMESYQSFIPAFSAERDRDDSEVTYFKQKLVRMMRQRIMEDL
jgi:hypothetical protein